MPYTEDELNYVYDKNNGYCAYCGKRLSFVNYGKTGARGSWHIDHSRSKANGGTDYLRNLVPACIDCNLDKSHRNGSSYKKKFEYVTWEDS
jgi:5-methylcytosine-specific restriction endonuclease McrA